MDSSTVDPNSTDVANDSHVFTGRIDLLCRVALKKRNALVLGKTRAFLYTKIFYFFTRPLIKTAANEPTDVMPSNEAGHG